MRTILLIALGFILLFGCASQKAAQAPNVSAEKPGEALNKSGGAGNVSLPGAEENKTNVTENATGGENATVYQPPPEENLPVERFDILAKDYAFTPSTITASKGSRVIIRVTSADRTYGFAIMDYHVNQLVEVNQTIEVSFVADKTGTFEIKNTHITSGSAYGMKGSLIVR